MNSSNQNQKNRGQILNKLKLNTKKVTIIALLLAVTTLISLFEIPTFFNNFLTLDFSNTILLLSLVLIGLFYTLLIAIIAPWLRLVLPHTVPSNVVGEFANMLSSISVVIIYTLIFILVNYLFKNSKFKNNLLVHMITAVISCLLISLVNVFYNWAFILALYQAQQLKVLLWTIFFPYNLFKFSFVFLVFIILFKPFNSLKVTFIW